eukprot:7332191-Prymnesium_polylepis.1
MRTHSTHPSIAGCSTAARAGRQPLQALHLVDVRLTGEQALKQVRDRGERFDERGDGVLLGLRIAAGGREHLGEDGRGEHRHERLVTVGGPSCEQLVYRTRPTVVQRKVTRAHRAGPPFAKLQEFGEVGVAELTRVVVSLRWSSRTHGQTTAPSVEGTASAASSGQFRASSCRTSSS